MILVFTPFSLWNQTLGWNVQQYCCLEMICTNSFDDSIDYRKLRCCGSIFLTTILVFPKILFNVMNTLLRTSKCILLNSVDYIWGFEWQTAGHCDMQFLLTYRLKNTWVIVKLQRKHGQQEPFRYNAVIVKLQRKHGQQEPFRYNAVIVKLERKQGQQEPFTKKTRTTRAI